jgi:serine/threonine protein kinase
LRGGGARQVAIKILKKPFSEHGEQICNELEILRSCRHDSIVNYLRSYLFKDRVWVLL